MITIKDNEIIITGANSEDLHRNFFSYLNNRSMSPQLIAIDIMTGDRGKTNLFGVESVGEEVMDIWHNAKKIKVSMSKGENLALAISPDMTGPIYSEDLEPESCEILSNEYICTSTNEICLTLYYRYTFGFRSEEDNRKFLESNNVSTEDLIIKSSNHSSSIGFKIREQPISSKENAVIFRIEVDKNTTLDDILIGFKGYLKELSDEVSV